MVARRLKRLSSYDRIEREEDRLRLKYEEDICIIFHLWKATYRVVREDYEDRCDEFFKVTNHGCYRRYTPIYIEEDMSWNEHYDYPTRSEIIRAFKHLCLYSYDDFEEYCRQCPHGYHSNECYCVMYWVTEAVIMAKEYDEHITEYKEKLKKKLEGEI